MSDRKMIPRDRSAPLNPLFAKLLKAFKNEDGKSERVTAYPHNCYINPILINNT